MSIIRPLTNLQQTLVSSLGLVRSLKFMNRWRTTPFGMAGSFLRAEISKRMYGRTMCRSPIAPILSIVFISLLMISRVWLLQKKKKHINDKYYFKNKNLNTACKIKKKERDIKATRNRWGICIKTIPCV